MKKKKYCAEEVMKCVILREPIPHLSLTGIDDAIMIKYKDGLSELQEKKPGLNTGLAV